MNGCEHYKVGQGQSGASDSQPVSMFRYLYNAKFTLHDFSPKLGEDFFFCKAIYKQGAYILALGIYRPWSLHNDEEGASFFFL